MTDVNVGQWGEGNARTAVLIHGLANSSQSWWQVGPELASRGYHVHAVDLPGHGGSAPLETYSVDALVSAVLSAVPAKPELALGHSLGGLVLAHAVDTLAPAFAVFEDPAFVLTPDAAVLDGFRAQKSWGAAEIDAAYPKWSPESKAHKLDGLHKWDVHIVDFLGAFASATVTVPSVPSRLILADPSYLVPPDRADELQRNGFDVRVVTGAGHVVHFDDYPGFLDALLAGFDSR